jgi:hypothetical protein
MGKDATTPEGLSRERLAALVDQDLTVRAIAAEVGRSATTVRYWLRRHGVQTTRTARQRAAAAGRTVTCPVHGEIEHVRRGDGRLVCKRCRAEAVTRRRRQANLRLIAEAGGRCRCCGYDRCAAALQFHHVVPSTKRFGVGSRGLARSIETLRAEAAKCVLVCANCHAELEAGVRRLS